MDGMFPSSIYVENRQNISVRFVGSQVGPEGSLRARLSRFPHLRALLRTRLLPATRGQRARLSLHQEGARRPLLFFICRFNGEEAHLDSPEHPLAFTLGYRLYSAHDLPDRAAKRDSRVHSGVPAGTRHRPHAPGDLREIWILLVWD